MQEPLGGIEHAMPQHEEEERRRSTHGENRPTTTTNKKHRADTKNREVLCESPLMLHARATRRYRACHVATREEERRRSINGENQPTTMTKKKHRAETKNREGLRESPLVLACVCARVKAYARMQLYPRCPGVATCLLGVNISSSSSPWGAIEHAM